MKIGFMNCDKMLIIWNKLVIIDRINMKMIR